MKISNSSLEIEEAMNSVRSRMERTNCDVELKVLDTKLRHLSSVLPDIIREEKKWITKPNQVLY